MALGMDAVTCIIAYWLALYLRLGEFVYLDQGNAGAIVLSIALALPIFITSGLYRAVFRYSGLPAVITIGKACLIYGSLFFAVVTVVGIDGTPRTIGIIQPVLLFLTIAGTRAAAYLWLGRNYRQRIGANARERVLIYGAGSAGRQISAALSGKSELKVVGFLDDDEQLVGRVVNGLTVYSPSDVVSQVKKLDVNSVLLAIPSATRRRRQEIIDAITHVNINIRTLPSVADLAQGMISISDIKELDLDDLLGREPVPADPALLAGAVFGKRVLVTGAGGSIGSELARQILKQKPAELVVLDHSEFALYEINETLVAMQREGISTSIAICPVLASVKDRDMLKKIIARHKPETVFHAAAYKHVPLVEQNVAEGILNNIFGTKNIAELALDYGVEHFVLISTDKAVRPTNVMGATKRWAELIVQDCATRAAARGETQKFSAVRFGNVIGSSGSVVPLFRELIRKGGPITLTHAEVTRYFMSIEEAVGLVLQAASLASGGEIFLLDMGEPVKVLDLAKNMIRLSGLTERNVSRPDGDIAIDIIGLRPGEKLYEELLIDLDASEATAHRKIRKAREPTLDGDELLDHLDQVTRSINAGNDNDAGVAVINLANR